MKTYSDYEKLYVIGEPRKYGAPVFMAFDGCGDFGDTCSACAAEKFESRAEARRFLSQDKDARHWMDNHPKARLMRIKTGYTVYLPKERKDK